MSLLTPIATTTPGDDANVVQACGLVEIMFRTSTQTTPRPQKSKHTDQLGTLAKLNTKVLRLYPEKLSSISGSHIPSWIGDVEIHNSTGIGNMISRVSPLAVNWRACGAWLAQTGLGVANWREPAPIGLFASKLACGLAQSGVCKPYMSNSPERVLMRCWSNWVEPCAGNTAAVDGNRTLKWCVRWLAQTGRGWHECAPIGLCTSKLACGLHKWLVQATKAAAWRAQTGLDVSLDVHEFNIDLNCLPDGLLLAIQHELGEPLNLNGDLISDLWEESVVPDRMDGTAALTAMFGSIALKANIPVDQQMLRFNRDHTIYDRDFRPPSFRRMLPSIRPPCASITVVLPGELKRAGSPLSEDEKPPKRQRKEKTHNDMEAEGVKKRQAKKKAAGGKRRAKTPPVNAGLTQMYYILYTLNKKRETEKLRES
ncbi:hypothetical protein DFH06DRAFT_1140371 [Mycena polygramma]|nr:hypothetical protein DFH06DRAFT_1140371 [Mycena polygramma]